MPEYKIIGFLPVTDGAKGIEEKLNDLFKTGYEIAWVTNAGDWVVYTLKQKETSSRFREPFIATGD